MRAQEFLPAIPEEAIISKIYQIRGQKVMIDRDLAELYGVEAKRLKEAVRRNIDRFPEDFMFELTNEEFQNWRTQIASSNSDRMGLRYAPYCFTEQGVTMLSCVLNSKKAIHVNIEIIRAFHFELGGVAGSVATHAAVQFMTIILSLSSCVSV